MHKVYEFVGFWGVPSQKNRSIPSPSVCLTSLLVDMAEPESALFDSRHAWAACGGSVGSFEG